jgi:hypothetical protein
LKVQRNDTHNLIPGFAVLPRCMASTLRVPQSSASGGQAVAVIGLRFQEPVDGTPASWLLESRRGIQSPALRAHDKRLEPIR